MTSDDDKASPKSPVANATWGPWLFRGVLVVSAVYFWWLVIYDHGVGSAH